MKTTLQKVKDGIAAALQGRTVEEMEDAQRQEAVCAAVGRFLESNSDWRPSHQSAPAGQPVKDSKQKAKHKAKRIKKTLGAGAGTFKPHIVDEAALERARVKCREIVAADPAAYSFIIESAPIKGTND
ncbi:hypothetical protein ACLH2B_13145 [Klebsiella sp. 2HUBk32mer]|uniref:Uncharacterized protein n=1 Tax=Buttiauxella agrestis TaxID=82977 RepID=A0A381C646_9ENTR|nr:MULTISPECIES: hypothetical protein [Enterobacteriaceae]ELT9745133.1 hypothetical protein [Klebsiella michiganensis]MCY0831478.1 hypothetical protein [Klebsiella michiganensis]MDD7824409.1 hypothetical protein [Klebsiella michiganensis]MDD7855503.1 hypothetical protein [Klebsiella michiganensis]TXV02514.1 hypothetical protein D4M92_20285 [Klebsiella michiganensis]